MVVGVGVGGVVEEGAASGGCAEVFVVWRGGGFEGLFVGFLEGGDGVGLCGGGRGGGVRLDF